MNPSLDTERTQCAQENWPYAVQHLVDLQRGSELTHLPKTLITAFYKHKSTSHVTQTCQRCTCCTVCPSAFLKNFRFPATITMCCDVPMRLSGHFALPFCMLKLSLQTGHCLAFRGVCSCLLGSRVSFWVFQDAGVYVFIGFYGMWESLNKLKKGLPYHVVAQGFWLTRVDSTRVL